jgi:hypothetical protein
MNMSSVWRAIAKKDCQDSIENIHHTVLEFPELVSWDDEIARVHEHLKEICNLLGIDTSAGDR